MSGVGEMLAETAMRLAIDFGGDADTARLTEAMAASGLLRPFSESERQIGWNEIGRVISVLGAAAPYAAVADSIAADDVSSRYGLAGAATLTVSGSILELSETGLVSGVAQGVMVPAAETTLIAVAQAADGARRVVAVPLRDASVVGETSISAEGRATYAVNVVPSEISAPIEIGDNPCLLAGALVRGLLIAGATSKVLSLTVEHCRTRKQFGRTLMALQAIQQQVAQLSAENAAAGAISRLAAERFVTAEGAMLVAAARVRTARSARIAMDVAHQCHGAIGFTEEYPLHRFTRAMMAWRREYGAERYWAARLGSALGKDRRREAFWEAAVGASGERQVA